MELLFADSFSLSVFAVYFANSIFGTSVRMDSYLDFSYGIRKRQSVLLIA